MTCFWWKHVSCSEFVYAFLVGNPVHMVLTNSTLKNGKYKFKGADFIETHITLLENWKIITHSLLLSKWTILWCPSKNNSLTLNPDGSSNTYTFNRILNLVFISLLFGRISLTYKYCMSSVEFSFLYPINSIKEKLKCFLWAKVFLQKPSK